MSDKQQDYLNFQDEFNLRELLDKYLVRWHWFMISFAICLSSSFIILRYTPTQYESQAKLLIKSEQGSTYSEFSAFQDLGLFDGISGYNNLYNEIEFLGSRPIIETSIRKLNLTTQYHLIGTKTGIERKEYYKDSPILVKVVNQGIFEIKHSANLNIEILNNKNFQFFDSKKYGNKKFNFGDTLTSNKFKFIIETTRFYKSNATSIKINVVIQTLENMISIMQSKLKIEPINDDVDILSLKLRGSVIERNNEFLDTLISVHTSQNIADQKQVYKGTTSFINDRLAVISGELSDVEVDGENYMIQHDFSDVLMSERSLYERTLVNEKKLVDYEIQLKLISYLSEFLENDDDTDKLLPTNLGLDDQSINSGVEKYNQIALERDRVLNHSSEKNPAVIKLRNDLDRIKISLSTSLKNLRATSNIAVQRLKDQEGSLNSDLSNLPKHKRVLRSIERQQLVKEQLYVYLLQKREENEIASDATEGNSKIIESAYCDGWPVNPNKKIYYSFALFLGLFVPFAFIYLQNLLDNKINGKKDLDKYGLPHLANIPKVNNSEKIVISQGDTSAEAESFRILRTNTSFILGPSKDDGGKMIITTSTIAKEGKSFIALNLATSYALTGKKTVVVGLDLRAPKLLEYANLIDAKGVTDFVLDPTIPIDSLVIPSPTTENLSFVSSGIKPPNPAEIMLRDEIKQLFAELRKRFDIIIVDTAPVALVTDTLLISDMSDAIIYVARANYLERKMLAIPDQLRREGKIKNIGIVINSLDYRKSGRYGSGYGYGYGYGYGGDQDTNKKWYQKIFRK
ncbi:MAG: polysaccharide biosynthesis tyrosine autokinase [Crocinitomicaceae bacterium]|nr:polysaccharide biosynthesis tyrosine autokinase [Crocinitomicaceae bacterium]